MIDNDRTEFEDDLNENDDLNEGDDLNENDDLNEAKDNTDDELDDFLGGLEDTDDDEQAPKQEEPSRKPGQAVNRRLQGIQNKGEALQTNVDIVLVIDCTESMAPLLDKVKAKAIGFHKEVMDALAKKNRFVENMRIKVIAFRDYFYDWADPDHGPMSQSEFFTLPDQESEFKTFVDAIEPAGGEDFPESALEALHLAFKSNWQPFVPEMKSRQIVVLFTDDGAHELDDERRFHPEDPDFSLHYPDDMPTKLEGMANEWQDADIFPTAANQSVKSNRLILFAPKDVYPWATVASWERATLEAMDPANGLEDIDMRLVTDLIAGSC